MIQEPCGLLRDSQTTVNFVTADAILAVHNHPHRHEPLIKADGGIFHDRSRLQSELRGVMLRSAVPAVILLQKQNVLAAATRAGEAFGPAPRYQIFTAVNRIGEVEDGGLKGLRFGYHALTIGHNRYFVNYIIALV